METAENLWNAAKAGDQPDPGASTPFDGDVLVTVRPERVHVIAAAGS